jgi:hypothetical protein
MKEACFCGRPGDVEERELVMNGDGYRALQCPECGHVDDLLWLSQESRLLLWEEATLRREVLADEGGAAA